ncbi:MAG: Hpt domain-containing protein [Lachnospiraceae bacterium]|nr:Hpt domain-containing protein [Lachnospiraceae bacterium]MBQ9936493.1 Hpt domain-containing protein [Lachnospiraceae bacterium]
MNNLDVTNNSNILDEYLVINKENGLKFCMDSEEFYNEILEAFVAQAEKFIIQLGEFYEKKDWANYAIVAHSLKSNTRTIGADNFADLSLKHELAGKANDVVFITSDYDNYILALKALMEKVKNIT